MININKGKFSGKLVNSVAAFLLALLVMFTTIAADIEVAYAENGDTPAESPYTSEEPQPTDTAAPTDEPQPSETPPALTEEPQPSETPTAPTEEPQPTLTPTMPTDEPQQSEVPQSTQAPQETEDGLMKITQVGGHDCVEGEIIVKFKDMSSDTGMINALSAVDSEVQEELSEDNLVVTEVPEGETIQSFIETMEESPDVEYAQPNYVYNIERTVNDEYTELGYQWYLETISIFDAWDVTIGSPDIKVAVIDTGIDLDHPDLSGKVYKQYDFVNSDGIAQDDDGHGTHVAGIIAANANNSIGISGIAPGVNLIAVKVLDSEGTGTTARSVSGINFAVSNGADVINMSYGGYYWDYAQSAAIDNAASAGVVCVAAAGNESTSQYSSPSDFESCISVMATDYYDTRADFSDYGIYKDISAPGCDIFSTYYSEDPAGEYCFMSGTSMASPVVAGVAALMLSVNPDLSVNEVKDILYSTAVDLGASGKDVYYGFGRVNAADAVYKTKLGTPVIRSAVSTGYNSITLEWNSLANATGYEVWRSTSAEGTYRIIAPQITGNTYTDSGLIASNTYYYKIKAYCTAGSLTVKSNFSSYVYTSPAPPKPSVSASSASYNSIRVSWSAVPGAGGYRLYRSTSYGGAYSLITTTTSTSYTNTKLSTGATYYYKVCAYTGAQKINGDFSAIASAVPRVSQVSGVRPAVSSPTKVKISWSSVSGRSGYEILRSTSPTAGFASIGTTTRTYYYDSKAAPNTAYYYKVRAYRTVRRVKNFGPESGIVSAKTVFAAVSGASARMSSVTSSKITWRAVSGRKGYEVWRSESPESGYALISSTSRTYYTDKKCVPNKTYYYKIRAYVMIGKTRHYSGYSNTASAATVLATVSGASARMNSVTSNKITWGAVSGRKGYEIWRSESAESGYALISSTSRTYYTDKKCVPNKMYYYKVRAYATVGKTKYYSGFSNTASAATVLATVSGTSAKMSSVTSNKITWSAVSGRKGYEVWRSETPDSGYALISSTSRTYYTDKYLIPNKTYYYRVRAYATVGKTRYYSGFSNTGSAKPVFGSVSGVSVSASSPKSSRITWKTVSGRKGYEILRSTSPDGTYTVIGSTSRTYYTDKKCLPGTTYYYKVRAYVTIKRVKRYSPESAEVSVIAR